MPPSQRATIIAANLLVPAGVLLWGWDAAAAVFLVWLDMLLLSARTGVLVFAALGPRLAAPPGVHKGGWMIGTGLGMLFVVPIFIAPPLVVGLELLDSLSAQFPQGPLAAAFGERMIYLWIAVAVLTRAFQRPARTPSVAQFGEQVLGLIFRAVILIWLAWLVSALGRAGLLIFLFAASSFLMYTELQEDWVSRLHGRFRAWEEKVKARRQSGR